MVDGSILEMVSDSDLMLLVPDSEHRTVIMRAIEKFKRRPLNDQTTRETEIAKLKERIERWKREEEVDATEGKREEMEGEKAKKKDRMQRKKKEKKRKNERKREDGKKERRRHQRE